jgi:spore maturation protein CgeB
VIKSQWGCNQFMYHPIEAPLRYSVTFVGQPHGTRRSSIAAIRAAGIDVQVWGKGWPAGRVSQEQMLRLFCQSRINLNLANASPARTLRGRVIAVLWHAAGSELVSPGLRRLFFNAIGPIERLLRPVLPREVWDPDFGKSLDQIKGRNFEVPGCAGFLLTGNADDLEQYYAPMREVATFDNTQMMIERLRYYLRNEDERVSVARAGYERTIREHTYVHRFTQIFERIGLKSHNPDDVLAGRVQPGVRTEV